MTEYEGLQKMYHQEYLLKQNKKEVVSKWQRARKLIKAALTTLNQQEEANMVVALKLASQALVKMQTEAENPPLKKIALDNMNGEPVWVVSSNCNGRWGIVNVENQSVAFYMDGNIVEEYWFGSNYIFKYKKSIVDYTEFLVKFNIKDV